MSEDRIVDVKISLSSKIVARIPWTVAERAYKTYVSRFRRW